MNVLRVVKSGMLTTVQDLGRPAYRKYGAAPGGAIDRVSHEMANLLVGNPPECATLEMTLNGDTIHFDSDQLVAVTGGTGEFQLELPGRPPQSFPASRPVLVQAGSRIVVGGLLAGCRAYLAVAGGFDVPIVMGSRSTYTRAAIGGVQGRVLKSGDQLAVGAISNKSARIAARLRSQAFLVNGWSSVNWFCRIFPVPETDCVTIRVIRGQHFENLCRDSQIAFFDSEFAIAPNSDRMGYRLKGAELRFEIPLEINSEGLVCGTIQLPTEGQPILIMADGAPTGGYPRVAHVVTADLPIVAQLRPGQKMRFAEIGLDQAHALLKMQRDELGRVAFRIQEWASEELAARERTGTTK